MAKRSIGISTILDEPPPAVEEPKSPVENLPVATGKKRAGRPKKVREAVAVEAATGTASDGHAQPPAGLAGVVTTAVEKALKKSKPAGPETRKGILGLVKQGTRTQVQKAVRGELRTRDAQAGIDREVHDAVTAKDAVDALATQHGQDHPFWHLLRLR